MGWCGGGPSALMSLVVLISRSPIHGSSSSSQQWPCEVRIGEQRTDSLSERQWGVATGEKCRRGVGGVGRHLSSCGYLKENWEIEQIDEYDYLKEEPYFCICSWENYNKQLTKWNFEWNYALDNFSLYSRRVYENLGFFEVNGLCDKYIVYHIELCLLKIMDDPIYS